MEPNGRPLNKTLTDRKKKAKISARYRLFFNGAGNISAHKRRLNGTSRSFLPGAGRKPENLVYISFIFQRKRKKIANFWGWTVLPGKIRLHSAQVRWRLTEQIPFSYRHFWKMSRWNSVKDILERDRWDLIYKGGVRVALKRVWRGSTASTVGPVPHGDS